MILPPSKPCTGIRLRSPKERLAMPNSSKQLAYPKKGSVSAKHTRLTKGPAKQSITNAGYEHKLPLVPSLAPSTSIFICVRSIDKSLAAAICPSSWIAAAEKQIHNCLSGVVAIMHKSRIAIAGETENFNFFIINLTINENSQNIT